jgi:5-(carboxyamino)imidazole ribonucleotide synthase
VLKTRRMGYDGRGQRLLRVHDDLAPAWAALGGGALVLESFVRFDRELSILGVRAASGECAFYPLIENHHRDGILRLSLAPAPGLTAALQARAEEVARAALEALGHEGVLAIELFQTGETLLANEIAPRVHNSGHWTIEGAMTSQFENHLRAIAGRPLGEATARGHSAMVNLIGTVPEALASDRSPWVHVHRYDKRPRPGRKLGHVTVCADDPETLATRTRAVWRMLGDAAGPMPGGGEQPSDPTRTHA